MDSSDIQGGSPFLEEAQLLLEQGHYDSARRLAEENLARLPFNLEGKIVLCRALLGMDALDSAREWIHEIDRWIHLAAQVYLDAGDSFARKGRSAEATRFYKTFLRLNPETPAAGEISARIDPDGESDRDMEHGPGDRYEHVEEIDRQFWTVTLADLYTRQGHLDMARGVLEEILRRDPSHGEARSRLEALPEVDTRAGAESRERLAEELARWLKNIDRLRSHGK